MLTRSTAPSQTRVTVHLFLHAAAAVTTYRGTRGAFFISCDEGNAKHTVDATVPVGSTPIGDTINGVTWTQCGMVSFPGDQTTNLVEITDATDPMYDENATDLNANHVTGETLLVGEKYNLLPVTITLRWKGITGKRTMTFRYLLINTPTGSPADFAYPGQN